MRFYRVSTTLMGAVLTLLVLTLTVIVSHVKADQQPMQHDSMTQHSHQMNMSTPLTSAGNYAFWTIQEVIQKLDADPKTDWSKVNLEALRQHLIDMQNFTLNVTVISQQPIAMGMAAVIHPNNREAAQSLDRVLAAHPAQLHNETGWDMKVSKKGKNYQISVITKNASEVQRINGLGYIGVMALGTHHQIHHWAMAKGANPHQ